MALVSIHRQPGKEIEAGHPLKMTIERIAYIIIAAAMLFAVLAGGFWPGTYCIPLAILSGGLTVVGVLLAQSEAYDAGRYDRMDMEDEE